VFLLYIVIQVDGVHYCALCRLLVNTLLCWLLMYMCRLLAYIAVQVVSVGVSPASAGESSGVCPASAGESSGVSPASAGESSFWSYLSSAPAHLGHLKDTVTSFLGPKEAVIALLTAKQAYDEFLAPSSPTPQGSCIESCTRLAETCFNNSGINFCLFYCKPFQF
jgi:hypothetical protein